MWLDQFQSIAMFATIAFVAAALVVTGLAMGVQFEPYMRKISSAILPLVLLAAFALSTLVSGRNASHYGMAGNLTDEASSATGIWILRLCTLAAVGFSALVVVSAVLSKRSMPNDSRGLFIAFCAYYVCAYVISGVFGTVPDISHKTLYPLLIVSALYITSNYSHETVLRVTRDGMLVFLVLGLLLLPLKLDLVAQQGYKGFIPGLSIRYWGLASHANNIGPLALFFGLILGLQPYRRKLLNLAAALVVIVTLIIAQSKTALGAALVVAGLFTLRAWFRAVFRNAYGRTGSSVALAAVALLIVTALAIFVADLHEKLLDLLLTRIQGRNTLLTGREFIWQITLAEWRNNPIFGYGPSLWGTEFSLQHGYFGIASNAHNQAVDTLGAAGIVGITALTVYVSTLGFYAFKLATRTHWLSVALFVFVLVRCSTEVPLKTTNVTTSDFFMHCIILIIFMRLLCEQRIAATKETLIPSSTPRGAIA